MARGPLRVPSGLRWKSDQITVLMAIYLHCRQPLQSVSIVSPLIRGSCSLASLSLHPTWHFLLPEHCHLKG